MSQQTLPPKLDLPQELITPWLPDDAELSLLQLERTVEGLKLVIASIQTQAICPLCQQPSQHIQSRYVRRLSDLPFATTQMSLQLHVRRFFCRNPACRRQIFTERLPQLAQPSARRTTRLHEHLLKIAFALGGEAGARFSASLGIEISPDTLLKLIRQSVQPPKSTPRVLGVDDWSFRRGRQMGTILVDLERRAVVDLLPVSTEEAFAQWLQAHPGVQIISRDRGEIYATGGRTGAPDALHVADRWHILKNLGEALQKLLARHTGVLGQPARPITNLLPDSELGALPQSKQPPRPRSPVRESAQRQRQLTMYKQVRELIDQGKSVASIARALSLNRITVRKYRDMESFRDGRKGVRISGVELYRAYVEQRWAEGCTQVKQLWIELYSQGYRGCYNSVWRFTRGWPLPQGAIQLTSPPKPSEVIRTPQQAMWLLMQPPEKLTDAETLYRAQMCHLCPDIALAYRFVQDFRVILRKRQVELLDVWLTEVCASGVRELRRFALGLQQDYPAVRAACEEIWSNGQVEGQVTRLKLIKRSMYGRARFDLLKARVLYRG
jgi:transposase